MEAKDMLEENRRRHPAAEAYNPLTGLGGIGLRRTVEDAQGRRVSLPALMLDDPLWPTVKGNITAEERLRTKYDFEFWAARCVNIRHKTTGRIGPLVLNRPQRRVLEVLERQRLAGQPIRIIILKARQWGGSTLVQCYMAWIQTVHRRNWNSYICAHVKDTAATIRGMFTMVLESYPEELWDGDEGVAPQFRPFERSRNVREIAGRGCLVTIGSAEAQEASRGADYAMAHLSEVGFWKSTICRDPNEAVRAICAGIPLVPYSFIAMESTANGVGSFFHREWLRAEAGESDKTPVFVPWYEIEAYAMPLPPDPRPWLEHLDEYALAQWRQGLTLEQMYWYHMKRLEMGSLTRMMAEYPGTPVEAFAGTGSGVFTVADVEHLARECREPFAVGVMTDKGFSRQRDGDLEVWEYPQPGADYAVGVDVGGRSAGADWSVIAVMRRSGASGKPEVVAQWRGHTDHDLLATKAERIARWYNRALLILESNTLETESYDQPSVVIHRLANSYSRLYRREGGRVGFHTNSHTKALALDILISAVRDDGYVERSRPACDELITYERLPNGSCAARRGCHDDMLMTRAILLYVLSHTPRAEPLPAVKPTKSWF